MPSKADKNIIPLIISGDNNISKWVSFFGLGIGLLLLLTCLQMFININSLLQNNNTKKNGFDFISVTKVITNDNMGKDNTFSNSDLEEIKNQKGIVEIAPLISNQFRVKANAGSTLPFSTDLFLETIPSEFIDSVPSGFNWSVGQQRVPIIFSSDFLEMYNVFAPSQDLPQLSDKTIGSVVIGLECTGNGKTANFKANIIGMSDRINSILVPDSFLTWANKYFGNANIVKPERVYIKTKDANNPGLIGFMDAKHYRLNKDKTKFGRAKNILQNIITILGVFGVLVIVLALLLFSFYLQLMIARSKDKLILLVLLGYSPNSISKKVAATWIPIYGCIIIIAMLITAALNYIIVHKTFSSSTLSDWPHLSVWATGIILLLLSVITNYNMVRNRLTNIENE